MSTEVTSTDVALATLAEQVRMLNSTVTDMRREVREDRQDYVSRGEWGQRNQTVDASFQSQGREIGQLRTELAGRRAPWWSVGAVLVSTLALAWAIVGPVL